jgi:hypothetical protein
MVALDWYCFCEDALAHCNGLIVLETDERSPCPARSSVSCQI